MSAVPVPTLPDSAPFTPAQRAWLNGFFAGLLTAPQRSHGVDGSATTVSKDPTVPSETRSGGSEPSQADGTPWHDPTLPLVERLALSSARAYPLRLMSAMAQLDCGSCGYDCRTYAEAIASKAEPDLTRCVPGGKETTKALKSLVAEAPASASIEAETRASVPESVPAVVRPLSALQGAEVTARGWSEYDRRNPFPARVLEARPLTEPGSGKEVRFLSLDLSGSGLTYSPGDSIGIYPENCPELVDEILALLNANGDEPVVSPEGWVVPARIALAKAYVITECGEDLLSLLSSMSVDPMEAQQLQSLARGEGDAELADLDLGDLLKRFRSAQPTVKELIPTLAPLRPRLYSISSSSRLFPKEVHLTVGVVRYRKEGNRGTRKGVASTYLAERVERGERVPIFVQTSAGFRPPAEGDRPMIMVGPGTGIAPFRAFLQERHASGARGPNWLFFGAQRRATDYLYRDELESHLETGLLSRLDLAFSRDEARKVYVQHRMLESRDDLWGWLQDGASLYVCGDARRMARDVDHALRAIVIEQGRMSDDDARAYLTSLAREGRYQRDVY